MQLLQPLAKSACKKVIRISLQRVINLDVNNVGHFIYECKYERPYISRPSRTQQLENPRLLAKLKAEGKPSVEVPEEFKTKYARAEARAILIYCTGQESLIKYLRRRRRSVQRTSKRRKRLHRASVLGACTILLPHLLPHAFHPGRLPHLGPTPSRNLAQILIQVPTILTLVLVLIPRPSPTQVPIRQPPVLQDPPRAIESGGGAMTHRVILMVLNKTVDTPACVRPFFHLLFVYVNSGLSCM